MSYTIDAYRGSAEYILLNNAFFEELPVTREIEGKAVTGIVTKAVLWGWDGLLGELWRFTLEETKT